MKKIIIMAILSFAISISISAQNTDLQKWANKAEGSKSLGESTKMPNVIRDAGIYLEKSAKYQYAAIGCAGVGLGLAIGSSFIGTKDYKIEDFDNHEDMEDKQKSDKNLRKGLLIGSGVCALTAICLEIASVNYKMKAGRSLRLYSTGTGGGLAYTF